MRMSHRGSRTFHEMQGGRLGRPRPSAAPSALYGSGTGPPRCEGSARLRLGSSPPRLLMVGTVLAGPGRPNCGWRRAQAGRRCASLWGPAAAHEGAWRGRLAQRESASFTPRRSLVRSQYRPPRSRASSDHRSGPSWFPYRTGLCQRRLKLPRAKLVGLASLDVRHIGLD